MASEMEVERLVVRLLGDGSSFQKMMMTAQQASIESAQAIKKAVMNMEGYGNSFNRFAATATSALASIGLIEWLRSARSAFEASELAAMKLANAISMSGGDVKALTSDYNKFAKSLSEVSGASKLEIMQMFSSIEMMGITGEAAKSVVQNTMAMSAAAIHVRGSWQTLHASIALARGDFHQAAHLLGVDVKKLKDEGLILLEVQRRLEIAFKQVESQGNTNAKALERLQWTFFELKKEVGRVISEGMKPWIELLQSAAKAFLQLDDTTKGMIIKFAALGAALLAIRPIMFMAQPIIDLAAGFFKLGISLVVTTAQMAALAATKMITVVLWAGWSVAVLTAKAAMLLFNAQMFVYQGLITGAFISQTAYNLIVATFTPIVLIAKAAVWLFNAALSVTNALLLGAGIAAAAVTFGVIGGALAVVGSALWGAYRAGVEFLSILSDLKGAASGPVAALGEMFREWGSRISLIARIAMKDMTMAWTIAKLAAQVAVSEISDLWPPLWKFISDGFNQVWQLVKSTAVNEFNRMMFLILKQLGEVVNNTPGLAALFRINIVDIEMAIDKLDNALTSNVETVRNNLKKIADEFKVVPSSVTEAMKLKFRIVTELAEASMDKLGKGDPFKKAAQSIDAAGKRLHDAIVKVSEFGKSEAMQKISDYLDKIQPGVKLGLSGGPSATPAGSPPDVAKIAEIADKKRADQLKALQDIRDFFLNKFAGLVGSFSPTHSVPPIAGGDSLFGEGLW